MVTELNYADILRETLMNQPVEDATARLPSALCIVILMALGGCGASAGSARGDSELQVQEPACYRNTKSEYEAAGTSQSPNAALLDIGAALATNDNTLQKCLPAGGGRNKVN